MHPGAWPWVSLSTAPRGRLAVANTRREKRRRLVVFFPINRPIFLTNSSGPYQVPLENPPLTPGADYKGEEPHTVTHARVPAVQERTDWWGKVVSRQERNTDPSFCAHLTHDPTNTPLSLVLPKPLTSLPCGSFPRNDHAGITG